MNRSVDAVVIGAGLSGLACAIRLAMHGRQVVALEAHTSPGGLNSFYRRGGRDFDTGLHAMTHVGRPGGGRTALTTVLRQLRIPREELDLQPQWGLSVRFPGCSLRFVDDFGAFRDQVAARFPGDAEGFERLAARIAAYDEGRADQPPLSARRVFAGHIRDPLLVDMLLCPLMFYGGAAEDDLDWTTCVIVWKGMFGSGLARPRSGMRPVVEGLVRRLRDLGGGLRLGVAAKALRLVDGRLRSCLCSDGTEVEAAQFYTSAGLAETLRLVRGTDVPAAPPRASRITAVEAVCVLSRPPADLGLRDTIVFHGDGPPFRFRRPEGLADLASGVVCCPGNFGDGRGPDRTLLRVSHLASHAAWRALRDGGGRPAYAAGKADMLRRILAGAEAFLPGASGLVETSDLYTPLTFERYTGRAGGALYGSPDKRRDGRSPVPNLFVIGADQGFHGIVGALLSGVAMANVHGLGLSRREG